MHKRIFMVAAAFALVGVVAWGLGKAGVLVAGQAALPIGVVAVLLFVVSQVMEGFESAKPSAESRPQEPRSPKPAEAKPLVVTKREGRPETRVETTGHAEAWIRTEGGLTALGKRIVEHGELFEMESSESVEVVLGEHPEDFVAVRFPDGAPWLDLVNLALWLDEGRGVTVLFVRPVSSSLQYTLYADSENEAGDTLVGVVSDGTLVEVYAPTGELRACLDALEEDEPDPELATEDMVVRMNVEGGR